MSKLTIVSLALVAATLTSAASSPKLDAIQQVALPLVQACSEELSIPEKDIEDAKESKNVDALNKCFYACFFKKIGVMTENGQFDIPAAIKEGSKYVTGDENIKKITDVANTCSSVNDQAGDAEGCERAKELLKCFIKEKYVVGLATDF